MKKNKQIGSQWNNDALYNIKHTITSCVSISMHIVAIISSPSTAPLILTQQHLTLMAE